MESEKITAKSLVDKAYDYAYFCHYKTNHTYDGHPYLYHLKLAYSFAVKYVDKYFDTKVREIILAATWAHDVIEDTRQTYNDVKRELGEEVAEIVYALTNEKGKTRAERANNKYYDGIMNNEYAPFVKLCDRLANVKYGKDNASNKMLDRYRSEQPNFERHLSGALYRYPDMFAELNELLHK